MITRVIVEMDGEPLGHYFRMHFEKQCGPEQRVLTEELRWLILAIFTMIEAVHALGFFLVKVDLDCMAFNPQTQQAQLLHAGFGTIIETERVKYKSKGGPFLVNRQTTESAACAAAAKRGDASHRKSSTRLSRRLSGSFSPSTRFFCSIWCFAWLPSWSERNRSSSSTAWIR